jgi:O-antigen/teichoic acid export membrane protein
MSQMKKAVFSSVLLRPLSLIIPLVTVALFPKYLGDEGYGLYRLIGATVLWLGMTNLGLTLGLTNKLTDCHVSGDRVLARKYVSSLTILLAGMTLAMLLLFSLIVPLVNWDAIFKTQDAALRRVTPLAVWVAGAVTLLGVVITLPGAIYFGYQEMHLTNLWDGAAKLATLGACVAVTFTRFGLIGVLLATAGVGAVVRIVNTWVLFRFEKPWLRPSLSSFDWAPLKGLMSEGILLFVLQLAALLMIQMDTLVIGIGLEPKAVTGYSIVAQFYISAYGLFMVVLSPLWPASGEAVRRGDIAWIRKSLRYSLLMGCSIPLLLGVVLYFFAPTIIYYWTRGQVIHVPRNIIVALALTFSMRAWVDCRSIILNSVGILRWQIVFYAAHAVLNFVVAIIGVRRFGVAGVAWATPITALFTSFLGYPWMIRRFILSRQK